MTFVRLFLRCLLVAFIAGACAAQPIALDACRASCDSARAAQAAGVPPCHRAAAGTQIGQPVRPCSLDHAVVPARPGVSVQTTGVASVSSHASLFDHVALRVTAADSSADPPSIPNSVESNTPLRV
jgi:hypothetical protein